MRLESCTSDTPFITVVMPVRNEEFFIADTLVQLLRQDYPVDRYEIIVVDGMSDDATQLIVEVVAAQHPQVHLFTNPARLSSAGRNIGFQNGQGDIFLVIDGHCYIEDDQLLRNTANCMIENNVDCLGRPQPLDPPGLNIFQKAVALARSSRLGHGGDSLIFGSYEGCASPVSNGAAYTAQIFKKIGYVDEYFDAVEDVEFNYRVEKAGFKCYTSPRLTVKYYPRESIFALFRQMIRYGKGRRDFTRKHPEALTFNQLIPAGFVAGLLLLFIVGITGFMNQGGIKAYPIITSSLFVLYGLYFLIIMFESLRITLKNGGYYLWYLPLIFFVIHTGLGWGFLRAHGSLSRKRPKKYMEEYEEEVKKAA